MRVYADAQHEHRVLTEDVRFLAPAPRRQVLGGQRRVVTAFVQALRDDGQSFACDITPHGKARRIYTMRQPLLGVISAITPFNSPLNVVLHKVGPALAGGNAVLIKPSEFTPLTAVPAASVICEASVAIVLAQAFGEKFGGDSLGELRRNVEGYVAALRARNTAAVARLQLFQQLGVPMPEGVALVADLQEDYVVRIAKAKEGFILAGARNGVACGSIEHKMGINGSATCVINLDNAVGYLVGERNKGMRAMFRMMNEARLGVGVQGLALATAGYGTALGVMQQLIAAFERSQRTVTVKLAPETKADGSDDPAGRARNRRVEVVIANAN